MILEKSMTPRDEDFLLSERYASRPDRARVAAIFVIHEEIRRIPAAVSEPPLGEIRLQWWREALDAVMREGGRRDHPAIDFLAANGGLSSVDRDRFERLIDMRARLLYENEFRSFEDLRAFLRGAEAPLASIALGEANEGVERLCEAYALARFAPVLAPRLSADAAACAGALTDANAEAFTALSPQHAGRIAFLALSRGYAVRPDGRAWPLAKRLDMFRAILTGRI